LREIPACPVSTRRPGERPLTAGRLASKLAATYAGATSNLYISSLVYLGVILLAITLITNIAAQLIVRRFNSQRQGR